MNIQELLSSPSPVQAEFSAQVSAVEKRDAKGGKTFWDLSLADGTGAIKLKIWSDNPAFSKMNTLVKGVFVKILGTFTCDDFGWGSKSFDLESLTEEEVTAILEGDPARRAFMEERWTKLCNLVFSMKDEALKMVTTYLLTEYETRYRRAGAARGNHHARRGGLVEHVTEMAELADAIAGVMPQLNRSLLIAGVVFHDCGKMLENQYEPRGFVMPFDKAAQLLGHIAIGFNLAHSLWLKCGLDSADERLLVLRHLILSHHGQLDYGSPVEPACPEAAVLHHIDQISAKTEMFKALYLNREVAPGLHDRGFPLNVYTVDVPLESASKAPPANAQ